MRSCGPGKFPKWRVQKVLWTQGAKVSEKAFAPPKPAFAPVQNGVAPVQEALCPLGPKDLLHPPLSTFGNFPLSVNFPGPQLPNPSLLIFEDVLKQNAWSRGGRFCVLWAGPLNENGFCFLLGVIVAHFLCEVFRSTL